MRVARTKSRPLASGELSLRAAALAAAPAHSRDTQAHAMLEILKRVARQPVLENSAVGET